MQTDDDTFVNVPALLSTIRQSCEHVDCKNERLYMGSEVSSCIRNEGAHALHHDALHRTSTPQACDYHCSLQGCTAMY